MTVELCEHPDCMAVGFHTHVVYVPPGQTLDQVWDQIRLFGSIDAPPMPPYESKTEAFRAAHVAAAENGNGAWFVVTVGGS